MKINQTTDATAATFIFLAAKPGVLLHYSLEEYYRGIDKRDR
jgi:hypothetical protein